MPNVKEKIFDRELESLRTLIQNFARPFPDDRQAQRARKERAAGDLNFFNRTYFPHYFSSPSSALHRYFAERYPTMILRSRDTGEGDKEADAAPRGNAKSTWTTLGLPLWCIAYKYRHFVLEVSETAAQGETFLSFIKMELETNERLKQDFPEICGEGPLWRATMIITKNGIKVQAAGSGQKLRGLRHGSKRPDLVIGDDLENDESVESADQRKKLESWFFKALMKIGAKGTVYIFVGTVLHYESLLNKLLVKPGWKGRKFKSVIRYSESSLWNDWELIFADISVGKEEAERRADAFFEAHREEMLAGTEVLWPEVEDYYYLMKMRISEGPAYFESEKQNEPINPEDAVFLEEWITYYDEGDAPREGKHAAALDPSMGKKSRSADPSAIIGGRMKNDGVPIIYVTVADIEKRHPDKIISDLLEHHRHDPFDKLVVEDVAFQEFFKDTLETEAHKRGLTLNVEGIKPNVDKDLRIVTLQPWIKNGWIRFPRGRCAELVRQLIYYRPRNKGGHDDGPDALEMLKTLLESGMTVAVSCGVEAQPGDYHAEPKSRIMGNRPALMNLRGLLKRGMESWRR